MTVVSTLLLLLVWLAAIIVRLCLTRSRLECDEEDCECHKKGKEGEDDDAS
jgi:hypothetical protein